jgi:RimJ/RimL family protein N-acetyltransferase
MTPALQPWMMPSDGGSAARVRQIAATVPVIETARLRLRAPQIGDFPVYARFVIEGALAAATDEVAEEAWLDFCQLIACWHLRGFGPWTIEPRSGGAAVGAIVVNHEFGDAEVELGWVLAADAEGRGLATEAACAARAHCFGAMGFQTLVSYIAAGNARSIAVASRLGAVRDHVAEARIAHHCLVYRHQPETA